MLVSRSGFSQLHWSGRLMIRMLPVTGCFVFIFAGMTMAQAMPPGMQNRDISDSERRQIIDSLAVYLDRIYVFPDVTEALTKLMNKNEKAGGSDTLTSLASFTTHLTRDWQEVSGDRHLGVRPLFDYEMQGPDTAGTEDRTARMAEEL